MDQYIQSTQSRNEQEKDEIPPSSAKDVFSILGVEPKEGERAEMERVFSGKLGVDPLSALQRLQFIDRVYLRWLESGRVLKGGTAILDALNLGISREYDLNRFLSDFRVITRSDDVLIENENGGDLKMDDDAVQCDGSSCHSLRRSLRDRSYDQSTAEPIDDLFFVDDTITINKKNLIDTCNLIVKRGLKLHYKISARVDTVNPELLAALKRSGCYRIHYGIESSTPRHLKYLEKGQTPEKVLRACRTTREAGIGFFGYCMIGIPWCCSTSPPVL